MSGSTNTPPNNGGARHSTGLWAGAGGVIVAALIAGIVALIVNFHGQPSSTPTPTVDGSTTASNGPTSPPNPTSPTTPTTSSTATPTGNGVVETVGADAYTHSDYTTGGGSDSAPIYKNHSVRVSCRVEGLAVPGDGNPWWYRISDAPWSNTYYVSADAFYNEPGVTTGSLSGTPHFDPAVAVC